MRKNTECYHIKMTMYLLILKTCQKNFGDFQKNTKITLSFAAAKLMTQISKRF